MPMNSDSGRGLTQVEIDRFLAGPHIARVSTVGSDGWPQISPVWYTWDGSGFLIVSKERTGLVKNLRRDRRCGLLVDSPEVPYVRVSVQGIAKFLPPDFDFITPMREMVLRYFGPAGLDYAEATFGFPRVPFHVSPIRMASWNGGGYDRTFHRETLWRKIDPPVSQ